MRHRRVTILSVIGLLLVEEIIEHLVAIRFGPRAHQIFDIVLWILLAPTGTWLMFSLLEGSETERVQTARDNDMQTELSQQLGSARSWEDLVKTIAAYPHRVAPGAAVTLYVYNDHTLSMQVEAYCSRDGQVTNRPHVSLRSDTVPISSLPQAILRNGTGPCPEVEVVPHASPVSGADGSSRALPPNRYDISVMRNNQQIGVLKLEYPVGSGPNPVEVRALKRAMPLIALALEGGLLQNLAAEQAAASETERQQIAQNLHDTLAQNISYLRLKLDQLTGANAIREIGAVLQELERMRATADEAYQQVRNTLDELGPSHAEDVVTAVTKQARAISDRAGIGLRSTRSGTPFGLPAVTRQQILYIAREALHNVEKHAQASQVHVQFLWLEAEMILKITDNGVGFDPRAVPQDGHYGLWIMQQRAQDIGGTLKISPSDEQGTEVTLWVPRPATSN